jgi:hypothetical protein
VQVPVANVKTTNKLGETRPNLYDKGAIIKVGDSFRAWENASRVRECFVRPWGHKACRNALRILHLFSDAWLARGCHALAVLARSDERRRETLA